MTRAGAAVSFLAAAALAHSGPDSIQTARREIVLGVQGTRFTVNGKPTFLLGISYYGGLGASDETIRRDLGDLKRHGFNWIRVWATWAAFGADVSAVDTAGNPRSFYLERLRRVVSECDRQQIIVDVTLSRGNGVTGPPRLQDPASHRRAVETAARALAPFRNWYLDLSNERNIQDKRFTSFADLNDLLISAKRIRPELLVTASHAGDITPEEVRQYLLEVRVDFLAPHRPRGADSAKQTYEKSLEYRRVMNSAGRAIPLHYQEPFRRSFGEYDPDATAYLEDLRGAVRGGAAGWCLHNGDSRGKADGRPRRSFDLRDGPLFASLDPIETAVIPKLAETAREAAEVPAP